MRVCITPVGLVLGIAAVWLLWSAGFGIYLSVKDRG